MTYTECGETDEVDGPPAVLYACHDQLVATRLYAQTRTYSDSGHHRSGPRQKQIEKLVMVKLVNVSLILNSWARSVAKNDNVSDVSVLHRQINLSVDLYDHRQ